MSKRLLILCALAALASGQVAPPQYPLAMKTRWTYEMRQEFGEGVHPSERDLPLLKGNVLETTVVSEVAGTDLIAGVRYTRVESRRDGRLWMTEWMRLTPQGLFLGKTDEDGDETLLTPPQKILSPRLAAGETWSWKASDAPVTVSVKVGSKETLKAPAGAFETTKIVHAINMVLPQATIQSANSRWFAPGVGYVRQETEVRGGGRLLTRTQLRLTAFKPAPGAAH